MQSCGISKQARTNPLKAILAHIMKGVLAVDRGSVADPQAVVDSSKTSGKRMLCHSSSRNGGITSPETLL
jgi:hypothetical protein